MARYHQPEMRADVANAITLGADYASLPVGAGWRCPTCPEVRRVVVQRGDVIRCVACGGIVERAEPC